MPEAREPPRCLVQAGERRVNKLPQQPAIIVNGFTLHCKRLANRSVGQHSSRIRYAAKHESVRHSVLPSPCCRILLAQ